MKNIYRVIISLAICSASFFAIADHLTIGNGYIRESIPGNNVTSAYMTITNNSSHTTELLSVSSKRSPRVEIHEHIMADGMMKMRKVDSLKIKANSSVELQPMGYHFMMFDLQSPLKDGEKVSLTFTFKDHSNFSIVVPVESIKKKRNHH